MGFNIQFNLSDYADILPDIKEYERNDQILNLKDYEKGNADLCVWNKIIPSVSEITSRDFREREAKRILKTGVWIAIKDEVVWIPPNYYFALNYGKAQSSDVQFRLKRLKHVYHKIGVRKNPGCVGSLTIKNRGDGETTMAITDCFWECLDGNIDIGQVGMQSKTRNDVINPCWNYVQTLWQNLPAWVKQDLCSDFASGKNIQEKMEWKRDANEIMGVKARNVLFAYYPSGTPMDGKHDMKKCLLDEICKWEECEFYDVFTNYMKFIMPGFERRGIFDMFSSPAVKDCPSSRQVHQLWKNSDPSKIDPNTGTTLSRVHRYYSNPLEGIAGAYDKWGDVNPQQIYDKIMADRAILPKDKLLGEIRGFPLNEEEMFGATEGGALWDNVDGIKKRITFLIGARFKDEETKEPVKMYGNLEWRDGVIDKSGEIDFRMADKSSFDVGDARFCISTEPKFAEPLRFKFNSNVQDDRVVPPKYIESVLGVDPYGKRYNTQTGKKRLSNGAGVVWKFRDLLETGINKQITLTYNNRPYHENIFFEDMIKAAIYTRSMVQFENVSDKLANYFEDRGYHAWLLATTGEKQGSLKTGDAPGRGTFLDEGIGLINAVTQLPFGDDPYLLERNWHVEVLDDILLLNAKDTHEQDLSMAWIQALVGAVKMTFKREKPKSNINNEIVNYLADMF